jgi:hypothetical protein
MAKKDMRPIKEILFSKSTQQGDCIIWTGLTRGRYGKMRTGGRKYIKVHRVSYQLHHGEIPEQMVVMHSCDNPMCINPSHLSVGTQRENVIDMYQKGRGSNRKGENNKRSKLKDDDIRTIRARHKRYCHKDGSRPISRDYGVSKTVIDAIINGKTWGHIQ